MSRNLPQLLPAILVVVMSFAAADVQAARPASRKAVSTDIQNDREIAALELRLFERLDYPLRLHKLEREIELTDARLASQRRRANEYKQFTKFKYSAPMFLTLEKTRLAVLESELTLKNLEEEKLLLIRHRPALRRLLELRVETASARIEIMSR